MNALAIWTVYDHPRDYPESFVARKWLSSAGGTAATDVVEIAESLTELRRKLPPGLTCLQRSPNDDPSIVETWL